MTLERHNDGKDSLFAVATDRQGSLVATQHTASGAVERYSYKPFGGRRDPDNWVLNQTAAVRFSRGYCMHEHVPEVGLIDMNSAIKREQRKCVHLFSAEREQNGQSQW